MYCSCICSVQCKSNNCNKSFLLKLPQSHIFAIFFRVFRWEWTGQHLHKDTAAPVHEDHARDHVQAGGAVCSLCAAHGQAEESGEPQCVPTLTLGVSLNLSEVMDTETPGYKAGQSILAAWPENRQHFTGTSWGRAAHTLLCRALLWCMRDAGGCLLCEEVCGYLDDAGVAVRCSPCSWCLGDQFGWSPLRPYPLSPFTFDFCSILPWLSKVWACC